MKTHPLNTDYLVVGAGAMGLAFADEIVTHDPSAEIILVDRRSKPGGHWNNAYPFVSLHQPAAYYGVSSLPLGDGGSALASGDEVMAYYGRVLSRMLDTGRVHFLGLCDFQGEGRVVSLASPDLEFAITVNRKTVDATYMKVEVPSTTPPKYTCDTDITRVPVNDLATIDRPWSRYVIIGAGKTGIDAVLFLLSRGVEPDRITWIMSNDAWLLPRHTIQPGGINELLRQQLEIMARCTTLEDILLEHEKAGLLLRLDPEVIPARYRCATVSLSELDTLRTVHQIVRQGRVRHIGPDAIELDRGTWPASPDHLYVDCTANALSKRPAVPIFSGDRITLQSVLMCQQVFSAAAIGHLEIRFDDDSFKNGLAQVVPHPEVPLDLIHAQLVGLRNMDHGMLQYGDWLRTSRLSMLHHEKLSDTLGLLLKTLSSKPAALRNLRRIYDSLRPAEPEPSITLVHGPLRFTAHASGPEDGPLVLCLHGFPDNPTTFRHQSRALAEAGYRVVVPTLRGYEPSSQPANHDYALTTLAQDVLAWMDHLNAPTAHLIGHDWGAAIAYVAAAQAPHRFETLVTLAVPHAARLTEGVRKIPSQLLKSWYMLFFQLRGLAERVLSWGDWALIQKLWRDWSPGYVLTEEAWSSLRSTFEAPGVKEAMLAYYRQNASPRTMTAPPDPELTTIEVPTLAITGADDGCMDTRLYDHVFHERDFPRGLRVERLEGAGHFAHLEQPQRVNALIVEWLERSTGR